VRAAPWPSEMNDRSATTRAAGSPDRVGGQVRGRWCARARSPAGCLAQRPGQLTVADVGGDDLGEAPRSSSTLGEATGWRPPAVQAIAGHRPVGPNASSAPISLCAPAGDPRRVRRPSSTVSVALRAIGSGLAGLARGAIAIDGDAPGADSTRRPADASAQGRAAPARRSTRSAPRHVRLGLSRPYSRRRRTSRSWASLEAHRDGCRLSDSGEFVEKSRPSCAGSGTSASNSTIWARI